MDVSLVLAEVAPGVAAAPMAPLPRILGQQQLQSRLVAGEEHHLLLDGFGVTIALEPRVAGWCR